MLNKHLRALDQESTRTTSSSGSTNEKWRSSRLIETLSCSSRSTESCRKMNSGTVIPRSAQFPTL